MPKEVKLRPAVAADAAAIAALHAEVWLETYRHLATPAALTALTEAHRFKQWQAMLAVPDVARTTIVAVIDEAIVGFGQTAPAGEPLFAGRMELKYLYIARSQTRCGIGRLLMRTMARSLQEQGHSAMGLGVVDGNDAAIRFYMAMGGRCAGRYTDPGPLWRSDNLLYIWDDLVPLTQAQSAA